MFNLDFFFWKKGMLPVEKRKDNTLAYLVPGCTDLQNLNTELVNFANDIENQLDITGQKIYLEKCLNDIYDFTLRRIFIDNNNIVRSAYIYNVSENKEDTFLFNDAEAQPPVYLNNVSEGGLLFDYTINIPVAIVFDEDVVRNKVNKYNPAGKVYEIITF